MYHCINVENITANCQYIHQRRIQHWVLSVIRRFYTKKLGQTEEWFCPSLYLSRRHEWTDSKRTFFFFSLKKSRFEEKSKEPEKLSGFFGPEPEMDPKRRKNPEIEDATLNTLTRTFAMDMNFRKVIGLVTQTSTKHRLSLPLKKNQKIWTAT